MEICFWIISIIYALVCILIIGGVMMQTSKSEGLAGIMGGSSQNMFKGKESTDTREEKLKKLTNNLCIAFVVLSIVLSFMAKSMIH